MGLAVGRCSKWVRRRSAEGGGLKSLHGGEGEREREGGDKYDVVQNVMCVCEDSFSSSDFTSC